jgi:ribosomal protein uS4
LKKDSKVEDVLNLTLKDILERRLQTLVYRKQLANNMLQARQFITHELIVVGSKKITTPSYLVSIEEEPQIRLVRPINLSSTKSTKIRDFRDTRNASHFVVEQKIEAKTE